MLSGEGIEIRFGKDPPARTFYTDARPYHRHTFAGVDSGFHTYIADVALLEVVSRGEQQSRLGRAHRAVAEIKFTFSMHFDM